MADRHGVVAFELTEAKQDPNEENVNLAPKQKLACDKAWKHIDRALAIQQAGSEADREAMLENAWECNYIQ
eukprot:8092881-Karenia_brevis.AAC.1